MNGEPTASNPHLVRVMDAAAREFYARLAAGGPATTRCPRCARTDFPPRLRCAECGGDMEWVGLAERGGLVAFTTQETALRFAAPAVLALAQLGDVVVPGVADGPYEGLTIGQPVAAEAFTEAGAGLALLRFRPVG